MKNLFSQFYKSCYQNTNGFIASKPYSQNMYPGDFFQIRNGTIVRLGNIIYNQFFTNLILSEPVPLQPGNWKFSFNTKKTYSSRSKGHVNSDLEFNYSSQILSLDGTGSFIFSGNDPQLVKILNWEEISSGLLIKLVQTQFSFREVYVVTECVSTTDWTLAIAGSENSEIEIATENENFSLVDLFGHSDSKTIQCKDVQFYEKVPQRKPLFFKAKKLVVKSDKLSLLINQLITQQNSVGLWTNTYFGATFGLDTSHDFVNNLMVQNLDVLDLLPPNALNPNTALSFFEWADMNMSDVEKLISPDAN